MKLKKRIQEICGVKKSFRECVLTERREKRKNESNGMDKLKVREGNE